MSSSMRLVSFDWNGKQLTAKAARAQSRAIIEIGHEIAEEAKQLAHVLSGTLQRSIHTAPEDYDGANDFDVAFSGVDLEDSNPATVYNIDVEPTGVGISVGSWVDYAIIEEEVRGHEFIGPAVEMISSSSSEIMVKHWKTEGL